MLDKFADELKEARIKSNISLQQMAAKSRIDIKFLEALDNGNFSFLPELYVKAFIKQYARVVGLDENETLKKYDLAREGRLYEKEVEPEPEQPKVETEKPVTPVSHKPVQQVKVSTFTDINTLSSGSSKENKGKLSPAYVAAGLIVILIAAVYFIFFDKGSDIVVEEKPFEKVLEQTTTDRFVEGTKTDEIKQVALDSLVLQVSNIDSSDSAWVLVIYDDVVKGDFLLYPRTNKTIKAARLFRITLGNSGVIRFVLNKASVQFEGRRGSVRHYKLDKNGIERLYSPPTLMQ
ncbi:MAG TPA: helix-turn-helix transcriptional regulator [Ignavibacteriaceae bacterium]|nr:helix-turn-helix transcriptional regulator [Ignavibacteriaceae bacterium]